MAEFAIKLPDVGEGVAQAEVVTWRVDVGDLLEEDEPFAEVMTDKATVELPSPVSGTVLRLGAKVGDFVAVGAPLLWVDLATESASDPRPALPGAPPVTEAASVTDAPPVTDAAAATPPADVASRIPAGDRRALAAPAVRKRARDLGIDLAAVRGTGPDGRVLHADLDAQLVAAQGGRHPRAPSRPADGVERTRLTGLRRNIARRMQEAHQIPHFTYVEAVEVDALEALRARLNASGDGRPHLTLLPFLVRAVTLALADRPELNARYDAASETLERFNDVHLGIATQTPHGLMVPVLRNAQDGDLWSHAAEIARLAESATRGTITLSELTGSTITITSLGALGGVVSTPVINAPEVAIIGVNRISDELRLVDGRPQNRSVMNLSSSFDHRIVDGAVAAQFIAHIKELLQTPALLFIGR
ncbi:dihydrolipoamide acetyltransferase family protein [Cumulibacter manganitolerans]|uniref:dihydrolipoamide acetyltransferase family protein n=1 Tax=Cumulibacter manganitolerans TaxID=1884992 RepID=UPI001294C945|nr:dihydrolipoamide acetyltransferase family protein [Cumulibacter manganitolerans]